MARASIRVIVRELCTVLNHAKEDKLITENPASKMSRFYKQAPVVHEEIRPLTREEVPLFLKSVLDNAPEHYPLFLCAIHTGLRSGELVGLQWGDVDFNGKFLTVRRAVKRGRVTRTKTDKVRRVDLSDALLSALSELKRKQKERWLAKGKSEIPEWVFCGRDGGFLQIHNVKNRHFFRCLEKAKLRRTFASLLIEASEPLAYVKEQLGHGSIKITVDVYGHLVPGANRQAVNRLPSLHFTEVIETGT